LVVLLGFAWIGGLMMISHGSDLFFAVGLPRVTWGSWPQTPAHVKFGDVYLSVKKKRPFIGRLIYGYEVNAQQFSGCCVKSFLTQVDALQFVDRYHAQEVYVRYRPEKPQESVLFSESDGRQRKCGTSSHWVRQGGSVGIVTKAKRTEQSRGDDQARRVHTPGK
jgi:hypothetical protein